MNVVYIAEWKRAQAPEGERAYRQMRQAYYTWLGSVQAWQRAWWGF